MALVPRESQYFYQDNSVLDLFLGHPIYARYLEDLTQQQGLQCKLYIGTLVGVQPIFLSWQSKPQLTMEKIYNSPDFGEFRLRLYFCTFLYQNFCLASDELQSRPYCLRSAPVHF